MGIDAEPLDPKIQSQLSLYPPEEIETATELLRQINQAFQTAQESSESFKKRNIRKGKPEEAVALDIDAELEQAERRLKILHLSSRKIAQQYQKATGLKDKARDRVVWALYERSHFNHLVETISSLVMELEELFPATCERQKELCRHEVSEFDSESLPLLLDVVGNDDMLLKEAVTTEVKARGMTFERITVKEHARTRFGHEYAAGETTSGGTDHVYKDMVFGGDSISHAGNAYGVLSVFTTPARTME